MAERQAWEITEGSALFRATCSECDWHSIWFETKAEAEKRALGRGFPHTMGWDVKKKDEKTS